MLKSNVSKNYIADQLGVTERTIENYLNGNRQPKPDALVKLAKILAFELSELSDSEQIVPKEVPIKKINNADLSERFIDFLEKSVADKERALLEKEADLRALRQAVEDNKRIAQIESTVDAVAKTVSTWEASVPALREFVTEQFAALSKQSLESVVAALGRKEVAWKRKLQQKDTQKS